jgi:hypothetical protein
MGQIKDSKSHRGSSRNHATAHWIGPSCKSLVSPMQHVASKVVPSRRTLISERGTVYGTLLILQQRILRLRPSLAYLHLFLGTLMTSEVQIRKVAFLSGLVAILASFRLSGMGLTQKA